MKIEITNLSDSKKRLDIDLNETELKTIRGDVLKRLGKDVSTPGFRKGKAPADLVEKQVGEQQVQNEVLEASVNQYYSKAIADNRLRPIDNPKVEIKKFVPFTNLAFSAEVDVLAPIKLADYKKIKEKRQPISVKESEVDEVIDNLRHKLAEKTSKAKAPAKSGDEVIINFAGSDSDGKPVAGASGKDFPLELGSDTFIPGFEKNLIGLKSGDKKEFSLTFPKDYGHKPLANKQVTFKVEVKKVNTIKLPKADDSFAKKVGPFTDMDSLRNDIRQQLMTQKTQEADSKLKDSIIGQLVEKSQIKIPEILLEDQIKRYREEFLQNLTYRGITLKEYLEQSKLSEDKWLESEIKPKAMRRVQIGLVLSEVAQAENIQVSDEELELRIQLLRGQYQDPSAQSEFDKPEMRRDVANRLLTEKTLNKLAEYATKDS